ncbi:polysaccharide lyase family 7 protein [Pseudonocardia cypriaca]|uniref:Alginate lyase n=1 Tax=Pseudonocardia cypriaca TaxID=882449 RepID=A0A543FYI0_9PSEU|nr:polysaccharide lyase family 7 protein [Pseudonocardia cypriaca]TQM38887.1 alginate lyase [Pseudonocardia cypriaca]
MARHRSPGTRHAPPPAPSYEQQSEQGDRARGARTPAHHTTVLVAVAMAAVIAVIGSMLSFAGALGPPSQEGVNLASRDLAVLPTADPPLPELPTPEPEPTTEAPPTSAPPTEEKKDDEEGKKEEGLGAAVARAVRFPAELIDPSKWYLTLPSGSEGKPDTVETNDLATYASKWFQLNDSKDGVVFTANAGGATTVNSHYPRSELREMINGEKASWDGRSGTHTMELEEAITKTPANKPDVISAQIHGGDDDIMQIHLSGTRLTVKYADGDKDVELDPSYKLGERFRVKIQSAEGRVKVWFNGALKADLPIFGAESYFKAGAYVNSNPSKGADPSDVGQVVIYDLKITHTA